MDRQQFTRLWPYLQQVPDPRRAQGCRYKWPFLLALLCAGMLSGQKNVRGIAQWGIGHAEEIIKLLELPWVRTPSLSTLLRALRRVDLPALEKAMRAHAQAIEQEESPSGCVVSAQGEVLRAQAADGKTLRGSADKRGRAAVQSLGLVRHGRGIVLAQEQVSGMADEASALPPLLAGYDLRHTVTTMDALHTHRPLAAQIVEQGGDYLMVVKRNQPQLWEAIELLFGTPPWPRREEDRLSYSNTNKGHGRLETRTVESSTALKAYVDWPGLQQVLRRTCRRVVLSTGEVSERVSYALTSLGRERVTLEQLAHLWRGHWGIENRNHYVRDETLGEDRCRVRTGHAAQALAILRNAILNVLRHEGWVGIPDALRHYGTSLRDTFQLLGLVPE